MQKSIMKTQRNMTMIELINYVRMRNVEYASKPSAPEISLIPTKKTISSKVGAVVPLRLLVCTYLENFLIMYKTTT